MSGVFPPYPSQYRDDLTAHASDHLTLGAFTAAANPNTGGVKLQAFGYDVLTLSTSRNLFNAERALDGSYILGSTGIPVSGSTAVGVSGLIPVTPGLTYIGSQADIVLPIRMYCFYTSTGAFLAGGSDNASTSFTAPAGAAFVRVTYKITGTVGKNAFQLEVGSTATGYVPFSGGMDATSIVSDKSISAISKSVNLFNPKDAIDGYYLTEANLLRSGSTFGVSGYIPVEPGQIYTASDWVAAATGAVAQTSMCRFTTFFDGSKNFVAGGSANSSWQVTIPAGVFFIRVTYNIITTNGMTCGKASFQFEQKSSASNYVPYSRSFLNDAQQALRVVNDPIWGAQRLRRFQAWKRNPDYKYDLVVMGDSYVDGNYFCKTLKSNLISRGFADGGPGLCAFANADSALASQSIDSTQLSCAFTTGDWTTNGNPSWGVSGSDVTSAAAGKVITLTAGTALASVTLIYKTVSGGAGFTYAINGGGAITVSTASGSTAVGTTVIDTSALGSSFTITITALGASVSLSGAVGRKSTANSLTIHKSGLTGSQASFFGGSLFKSAATPLMQTAGGVIFIWGTNDIAANVPPSLMKQYVQNLVNYWRSIDPMCDLVFMGPQQTSRGIETVTTYLPSDYNDVMYQLAVENNGAAFVGFEKIFGAFSQTSIDSGFMNSDRVHPGTRGGSLMAETLTSLLS